MKRRAAALVLAGMLSACLALTAAAQPTELVPVGRAVGLELETGGVYVAGVDETAQAAGLIKPGDRVLEAGGRPVTQPQELAELVQGSGGEAVVLRILRRGRVMSFTLKPELREGRWRLGLYLREKIAGIGTVTFYDPATGRFGALGHGVSDPVTGAAIEIKGGLAHLAAIESVVMGERGKAGELVKAEQSGPLAGTITQNTPCGLFGLAEGAVFSGPALPVAQPEEVTPGKAEILSCVAGDAPRRYAITILSVHADEAGARDLELRIDDKALLSRTGGIVQGMSGSPILQNGKLVGAVTHVLVQSPARGYGIFLTRMLEQLARYEQGQAA